MVVAGVVVVASGGCAEDCVAQTSGVQYAGVVPRKPQTRVPCEECVVQGLCGVDPRSRLGLCQGCVGVLWLFFFNIKYNTMFRAGT